MSPAEEREVFFQINKERLEELAHNALTKYGFKIKAFAIVCIDVDDPSWTELVDHLMPNHDWQQFRDKGGKPVLRGSVTAGICELFAQAVPDIAEAVLKDAPEGLIKAVVLGSGGASLYYIRPISGVQHNWRNN